MAMTITMMLLAAAEVLPSLINDKADPHKGLREDGGYFSMSEATEHQPIDNHLDINETGRSDCIRGKISNSDGTTRSPLTGGASCFDAATGATLAEREAACNAKYEVKDRSTHRRGQASGAGGGAAGFEYVGNGWCLNPSNARIGINKAWYHVTVTNNAAATCESECAANAACIGYGTEDGTKCQIHAGGASMYGSWDASYTPSSITGAEPVSTSGHTRNHCWRKTTTDSDWEYAFDLLGEVQICQWNTNRGAHKCETGQMLSICPEESPDPDEPGYVVHVGTDATADALAGIVGNTAAGSNVGITQCEAGEYLSATSICTPFTVCTGAEYETVAPVATTQNRVCATKECTCTDGTAATGTDCPAHGTPRCTSCNGDHWLSNGACPAWTPCTSTSWEHGNQVAGTEWESVAPTATSDRVCTPHTVCDLTNQYVSVAADGFRDRSCTALAVCSGSQYETVSETATSDRACQAVTSCSSVQYQTADATATSDRVCAPLTVCDYPATQYESVAETATSDRQCATLTVCSSAQYQSGAPGETTNRVCATKQCYCSYGTAATGAACPTQNTHRCSSCWGTHQMSNNVCVATPSPTPSPTPIPTAIPTSGDLTTAQITVLGNNMLEDINAMSSTSILADRGDCPFGDDFLDARRGEGYTHVLRFWDNVRPATKNCVPNFRPGESLFGGSYFRVTVPVTAYVCHPEGQGGLYDFETRLTGGFANWYGSIIANCGAIGGSQLSCYTADLEAGDHCLYFDSVSTGAFLKKQSR